MKHCTVFLLLLLAGALRASDTLQLRPGQEEFPVYRSLLLARTSQALRPGYAAAALHFTPLFPDRMFSERLPVARHYWLKLTVKNDFLRQETFYFQFNSQVLDHIMGWQQTAGDTLLPLGISGTNLPFSDRAYPYCDLTYALHFDPGKTTTLLFMLDNDDGNNIHFFPQLRTEKIFKAEEERFYMVTGFITGLMLTVFVLNVFLGISLRMKLHLVYALYTLVALYEIYTMQGLDVQYLYPRRPWLSGALQYLSPCLLGLLMTRIMQRFLDQRRDNSRIKIAVDIGFWTIVVMVFLNGIVAFVLPDDRELEGLYEMVLAVVLLVQCLLFVASAVEKVWQGYKPAWFYLAAVLCFLVGLGEFIFMVLFGGAQELVVKAYPNHIELGIVIESVVVFLGIVYRYNTYKKEKERLQQRLITDIVAAEEAERKRLARDLHDDLGSTLSTLSIHLSNLQGSPAVDHSLMLSNKAVQDIRHIAHNLIPKDFTAAGLFNTVQDRIRQLNYSGSIIFSFFPAGNDRRLSEVYAITVYRIVNELLTNISRHSRASEAALQVVIDVMQVQIMTEDDGIGFDNHRQAAGIGLKNIRGRVEFLKGSTHIDSNPQGTQTIINIPLP